MARSPGLIAILSASAILRSFPSVDAAPMRVLLTIDVESVSPSDPRTDPHGIARIMDIMERKGIRGTFYVNVYEAAESDGSIIRNAARTIHERGHDLELHTHPESMFGKTMMSDFSLERQIEILEKGKYLIKEWVGEEVVAHRAGSFGANLDTLKACRRAGLLVDSSLSPAYKGTDLARQVLPYNGPVILEEILELPVTYYAQARLGSWQSLRILDVEGSTLSELERVIRQAKAHALPAVNILLHNFSFIRYGTPEPRIERRFEQLVDFLADEEGVETITAAELYRHWKAGKLDLSDPARFVPYTGFGMTYARAVEDIDRGWKNVVVVIAPPCVLIATLGSLWILVMLRRRKRSH